jgi:hypothetical protein
MTGPAGLRPCPTGRFAVPARGGRVLTGPYGGRQTGGNSNIFSKKSQQKSITLIKVFLHFSNVSNIIYVFINYLKENKMPRKYNPFRPNQPIYTGMFAGRMDEIKRIADLLYQTKEGNPSHILIHGERGIGKTSLLLVARHFAQGNLNWGEKNTNFFLSSLDFAQPQH